jgi:1-acyl-sn-glycerol-3-phosphate acyltransferase
MLGAMRSLLRFAGVGLVSVVLLAPALVSRLLARLGSPVRAMRVAATIQGLWARALARVIGLEIEHVGSVPRGVELLVANHQSYLDVIVLAARAPGRFVAKSEIAGWPFLGHLARSVGTIFVVQKKSRDMLRVDREMSATLAAGVPVILFPEGHATGGATIDPLHSSLLAPAARADIPCRAVTISYTTPGDPWTPAATVCWWGGMGFWRHAWGLCALRRVRAIVRTAPEAACDRDRKRLAAQLHADLLARFDPLPRAPLPPSYPWPHLFPPAGDPA